MTAFFVTVALLTMALALSAARAPAVVAAPAPGLTPDGMAATAKWSTARSVQLEGFGGAASQAASARALWNKDWFFFEFMCADDSVISPGRQDGLDHFRLGDTAEIFIARRGAKDYAEIHATPAGRKSVYFFSGYRQPASVPHSAQDVRVESSVAAPGWRAVVAVPRALPEGGNRDEETFDIFFARYDYERAGAAPVLSSFPGQRGEKPDFHRRPDYAVLHLGK